LVFIVLNKSRPEGVPSARADEVAHKMLAALQYDNYLKTDVIEWTFKGEHSYVWDKQVYKVRVSWEGNEVEIHTQNPDDNKVITNVSKLSDKELVTNAIDYFNNDSFWLVGPYKVFDPGTKRSLVTNDDGVEGLLVEYTQGGTTPGDAYLWYFDENFRPTHCQMWVKILYVGGLKATWEEWKEMASGCLLSQYHHVVFKGISLTNVKAYIKNI